MKKEIKNKLTRCPRLGHEITFSYCLQEAGDLPCIRIMYCWQSAFDVKKLLKETLTSKQWQILNDSPTKDKITNILELIEKAKTLK